MDTTQAEAPEIAARVAQLTRDLRAKRPERFATVGRTAAEIGDDGLASGEAPIGTWATGVLRQAARADVFFSTSSSFRAGLPPGDVTLEDFYGAIPYPNKIATARVSGALLLEWLAYSVAHAGSDVFSQQSGLRYTVQEGKPTDVKVQRAGASAFDPLDPSAVYVLGTTDFQAYFVDGYKQLFAKATDARKTDTDVHATLLAALKTATPEK